MVSDKEIVRPFVSLICDKVVKSLVDNLDNEVSNHTKAEDET